MIRIWWSSPTVVQPQDAMRFLHRTFDLAQCCVLQWSIYWEGIEMSVQEIPYLAWRMVHVTVRTLKIIILRKAVVIALANIENWSLRGFIFHFFFIFLLCALLILINHLHAMNRTDVCIFYQRLKSLTLIHFLKIRLSNFLGNIFLVKIYKLLQNYTFEINTLSKIM